MVSSIQQRWTLAHGLFTTIDQWLHIWHTSPREESSCGDRVVIECQLLWIVLFNRKNFNQYFWHTCFTYPRIERGDSLICNLMVMWLMNPWIRLIKSMNEVLLQLLGLDHNRNRSLIHHNFESWSLQFNRDGLWTTDCL